MTDEAARMQAQFDSELAQFMIEFMDVLIHQVEDDILREQLTSALSRVVNLHEEGMRRRGYQPSVPGVIDLSKRYTMGSESDAGQS